MSTPRPNRPLRDDFDDRFDARSVDGAPRPSLDGIRRRDRDEPASDPADEPVPDDDIAVTTSASIAGGVSSIARGGMELLATGFDAAGDVAEAGVETAVELTDAVIGKVGDIAEVLAGGSNPWADPEPSSSDDDHDDTDRGDIISELGDDLTDGLD